MPNSNEGQSTELSLVRQLLEAKFDMLLERMDAADKRMEAAVTKEVMDLRLASLQEQLNAQKTKLDALDAQLMTQWQKLIARAGGIAGLVSASLTALHFMHVI